MNKFSQDRKIDNEIYKRKKRLLRRERMVSVIKQRLKIFKYVPFLAFLVYLFFYTPLFVIKEIESNTLRYIDEQEVIDDFQGLIGENFFLTDLSTLRKEAIKKYSFIENIYTEKIFPNSVIVHVREKEPFVVVQNNEGCYLLDNMGFVLLESECSVLKTKFSVKEVIGEDLDNIEFVENTQSNFYNTENIYKIINVLEYYGYNVKSVEISGQKGEFILYDERSFIFTFADDIELQLKRFIIVIKKVVHDNMSFKTIDIRYHRPVLREQ